MYLNLEIHYESTYTAGRPLKTSKYDQKIKVEKTPDFVLSHPVHFAHKIFLKIHAWKMSSRIRLLLGGAKFAVRYGDRCELR